MEKIAFLATPHTGSKSATWGDRLRIIVWPTAATACLVRNHPNLRSLNRWYRGWANEQRIAHLVLTETKALRGRGVIVEPDSGDPGLPNADIVPIDADHVTVCKPPNNKHQIYTSVKRFIERRVERPRDRIAELADGMDELASEVARQVTTGQNERFEKILAKIGRDKGVEVAPLLAVLVKLGEAGVKDEDIPKRLDAAADELIKVRAENEQLRRGPPALAAIAEEVQALLDKGEFDDACRALAPGREAARAVRIDASRYEAAILAQEARVHDLQLAYRTAAAKYAEAAGLVAPFDTEQQWRFLLAQAGELYRQGDEFGDNAALTEAIEIYRRCLALAPGPERPIDWATTQSKLGDTLRLLGERGSGTARLEEAVAAFRDALQEQTRAYVPLQWAGTQNNLGIALFRLGERESGTARLEEAVFAFREALQEYNRERVPLEWATTQMNLGNALASLGERGSGTARLKEAVSAYREALQEFTREREPLEWAKAKMNLGNSLASLGERESGTARLKEAVSAYRDALQENTRERKPLEWAKTQTNLGGALAQIGQLTGETAYLEEAIVRCRDALDALQACEHVPVEWARTQNKLGEALTILGELEIGTAGLDGAFTAHHEALKVWTHESFPLQWARTKENLARARFAYFSKTGGPADLARYPL